MLSVHKVVHGVSSYVSDPQKIMVLWVAMIGLALSSSASAQAYYGPPFRNSQQDGQYQTIGSAVADLFAHLQTPCNGYKNCNGTVIYKGINTDTPARVTYLACQSSSPCDPNSSSTSSWSGAVYATQLGYDEMRNAGNCYICNGHNGDSVSGSNPASGLGDSAIESSKGNVSTPMAMDPVNLATGNKFQQDTDFRSSKWLTFRRFYNSTAAVVSSSLGVRWRHSFDRSLDVLLSSASSTTGLNIIYVSRPDGSRQVFQRTSGSWKGGVDNADILSELDDIKGNPTGYMLFVAATQQYENYSTTGLLQSIMDQAGTITTLIYSTTATPTAVAPQPNLLLSVIDPTGRSLQITYDGSAHMHSIALPDGGLLSYGYDSVNNLTSVEYPDGQRLQYVYNEQSLTSKTNLPNTLTGVIDESGVRFESTGYTSNNHVISSSFAGGADASSVSYPLFNSSATLLTPLGSSIPVHFKNVLGALKLSSNDAFCGPQCSQSSKASTYDANGYPATTTSFNNIVTKTTYNTNGQLTQQVDASGTTNERTTNTAWDVALNVPLTRIVVNNNAVVVAQMEWVYNSSGQPTAQCQVDPTISSAVSYSCSADGVPPSGVRRWTSVYCSSVDATHCPIVGLLISVDGPRVDVKDVTTYAYYMADSAAARHGDLQTITDGLGHVTTYASYDGAGRITRIVDPNGVITDLAYAPRGWLQSKTIRELDGGAASSDDAISTIKYTPYGAVASITDADGILTTYGYDSAHRLTTITDGVGDYVQYTLDASGNRKNEKSYSRDGVATRSLSHTFNKLGQLTAITDGLSHQLFDASGIGNYDSNGNLLQSVDALGFQRRQNYDALNRLLSTVNNYNGADATTKNTTIIYAFDALDQLISIIDPSSLKTAYVYDGLGNSTSLDSPDSGVATGAYDAAGNQLTHIDAKSVVSTSTYDALNRLSSLSYNDATLNVGYYYDEPNRVTNCGASSPLGRLTRVIEKSVTTTYCYDRRGNITQKLQQLGSDQDSNLYSYTKANRLDASSSPSSTTTTYTRDAVGRVVSLTVSPPFGAVSNVVSSIVYRPFGPIASYTLGNGQTVTRTYDANYRVTDISSLGFTLHLAHDPMGNVSAIGAGTGADPFSESYGYDPLYRLSVVKEADGSARESYTYNQTGDRTNKTASGLATGSYLYTSGTHQLASTGNASRASDANGNTINSAIGGSAYGYGYNGGNRLTIVQQNGQTVGSYTYNALGERIRKVATSPQAITERYNYNESSQLVGEYGTTNRDYIWLGELPLATIDNATNGSAIASTINYVTADQNGAPRVVTDSTGAVVWSWAYQGNPFGEQQPTSSGYVLNLRYPGQYYDAESGTNYNVYRTYEPATGRYLQSDPMGLDGGISTYAYVGNNPLGYSDPLGLADCTLTYDANRAATVHCVAQDAKNSPVDIPVASGNNGDGTQCKNNPACQDQTGRGPIPLGDWHWTDGATSKPNGRVLEPDAGTDSRGRTDIRSHSCANAFGPSTNGPFCSEGCVTGQQDDIRRLNALLDAEPNSRLHVVDGTAGGHP